MTGNKFIVAPESEDMRRFADVITSAIHTMMKAAPDSVFGDGWVRYTFSFAAKRSVAKRGGKSKQATHIMDIRVERMQNFL